MTYGFPQVESVPLFLHFPPSLVQFGASWRLLTSDSKFPLAGDGLILNLPALPSHATLSPMPDVRDHAVLQSASARMEELIAVCRPGGNLHTRFPNLTADVSRRAKGLNKALAGLVAALDTGVDSQPEQPIGRRKDLRYRIYFDPLLTEMVRFVGNAGRNELEFWDFYRDLAGRYTVERASAAYEELCGIDKSKLPATIFLKPEVRALCDPLLGERGR